METHVPPLPAPDVLTIYGADWCVDCRNIKRFLDDRSVAYRYVDLMSDPAAQVLLDAAGYRGIPIVSIPDGTVLVDPSRDLLTESLARASAWPVGPPLD
jgi:mycoredoxin